MKTCRKCGVEKELKEFHSRKQCADGRDTWCTMCRGVDRQNYYDNMPAQVKAKAIQRKEIVRIAQYDKDLAKQGGVCAICKEPWQEGTKRFSRDHCHVTGKRRKLLCQSCNYGLGCFKDDPVKLRAAAKYLTYHK